MTTRAKSRSFDWPSRFGVGSLVAFFVDGTPQGAVSARVLRVVDDETLELEVHLRSGAERSIAKRATNHPRPMCTWDFLL
jgi:hypothetical protein